MSTPPETPSPRILAREAAGLLLVAVGVLVVLVTLGAIHPVLSTTAAATGTFAAFRFMASPKTKTARAVAISTSVIAAAAAVGCTFAYFPLLGWVEVGAALSATGTWLASEGT
ncbi:hypothetical protein [Streptomyces sp. ISL-100]|uniref:hypothetical protein n=1 Tax=Streptomyces sp. ISL-100 TaxID=2819173 RepID=UPI001BEA180E|nr:hypothetical protein [Streptomyces sp. ISL-100]MBT2396232.1 hypothetical protein [Streptomyces sp. ISL-100]